jgi:hypothetical protein
VSAGGEWSVVVGRGLVRCWLGAKISCRIGAGCAGRGLMFRVRADAAIRRPRGKPIAARGRCGERLSTARVGHVSEARIAESACYPEIKGPQNVSEGGLEPPDNRRKHRAAGRWPREYGHSRGTSRYVAGLRRHRVGHVPPEFNPQRAVGTRRDRSGPDDSRASPGRVEAVERTRASMGGEASDHGAQPWSFHRCPGSPRSQGLSGLRKLVDEGRRGLDRQRGRGIDSARRAATTPTPSTSASHPTCGRVHRESLVPIYIDYQGGIELPSW